MMRYIIPSRNSLNSAIILMQQFQIHESISPQLEFLLILQLLHNHRTYHFAQTPVPTNDLNYISHLRGEKSNVNIEVQGALKDESKKHFKGTIDFKKGSKKSIGNENESCMLLSDKAKSISLPMLLCSEEDVKGNHSSSAGKIDPKVLFYIMTRGFDLKDAMKLVVKAKFDKILENIEDAKLKKEIIDKIDEKID